MKKSLMFYLCLLLCANPAIASVLPPGNEPLAKEFMIPLIYSDREISIADFVALAPGTYKQLTGKKLGWKQTVELKYLQKHFRNAIREDGTVDREKLKKPFKEKFKFHWGGFLLGFFLPLIGLFIVLLFNDENKINRVASAWIGFSTLLIVLTIIIVATTDFSQG